MPTVTFSTGQKVNFASMPSQTDIQEVATKMGVDSPPASPTQGLLSQGLGAVKNFAKNIISAPVTMAARPGQLLGEGIAAGVSKLTGDPKYYNNAVDTANQPSSLFGGMASVKPVNQETPESMAGEGLSTVALGAPGSGSLSIPATGALTGAMGAAGSSMQNNDSAGNVAANTAVGGLMGYGTGLLTQGISSHFNAPKTMEDYLIQSGITDEQKAPGIANALRNVGITDLSSKEAVINAQNTMARNIQQANEYLTTNGSNDAVTGELNDTAQRWTDRLGALQKLNSLLPGVGKYVNAITPNLLRHGLLGLGSTLTGAGLLTNAIPKAASFLKDRFIGTLPNFVGQ